MAVLFDCVVKALSMPDGPRIAAAEVRVPCLQSEQVLADVPGRVSLGALRANCLIRATSGSSP